MLLNTVEISPVFLPDRERIYAIIEAVVVFPFVPVTPIKRSPLSGKPKKQRQSVL